MSKRYTRYEPPARPETPDAKSYEIMDELEDAEDEFDPYDRSFWRSVQEARREKKELTPKQRLHLARMYERYGDK